MCILDCTSDKNPAYVNKEHIVHLFVDLYQTCLPVIKTTMMAFLQLLCRQFSYCDCCNSLSNVIVLNRRDGMIASQM